MGDTTVSDGSFDVNVKAAGVSLQKCRGDLCSPSKCSLPAGTGHVNFQGVACPLAAGDVSLDFDVKVSRFVPSSLANLDIEITSEGSAGKLLCAKISTSPGAMELEKEHVTFCESDSDCPSGDTCFCTLEACFCGGQTCQSDSDCPSDDHCFCGLEECQCA